MLQISRAMLQVNATVRKNETLRSINVFTCGAFFSTNIDDYISLQYNIYNILAMLDINWIEMALHILKIWRYKTGQIQKGLFFQIYLGNGSYGFRVQKELKVTNIQNDNLFCYKIFLLVLLRKHPALYFSRCVVYMIVSQIRGREKKPTPIFLQIPSSIFQTDYT